MNEQAKKFFLTAQAARLTINKWGIKLNGQDLEKVIDEHIGNSEDDNYKEIIADVRIEIVETPTKVEIRTDDAIKNDAEKIAMLEAHIRKLEAELGL